MNYSQTHIGLSDLLEQDLSSYELFCSLPPAVQKKIQQEDPKCFEELQTISRRSLFREAKSSALHTVSPETQETHL